MDLSAQEMVNMLQKEAQMPVGSEIICRCVTSSCPGSQSNQIGVFPIRDYHLESILMLNGAKQRKPTWRPYGRCAALCQNEKKTKSEYLFYRVIKPIKQANP